MVFNNPAKIIFSGLLYYIIFWGCQRPFFIIRCCSRHQEEFNDLYTMTLRVTLKALPILTKFVFIFPSLATLIHFITKLYRKPLVKHLSNVSKLSINLINTYFWKCSSRTVCSVLCLNCVQLANETFRYDTCDCLTDKLCWCIIELP